MLYIVLVLVLAALGLLVTALITASSLWAWVSIGLSVLAGVILVADWLRRRRRSAASAAPVTPAASAVSPPEPAEPAEEEQTTLIPASGDLGDPADTPEPLPADEADASPEAETNGDSEPEVEETPESDIAVLADLEDEVVVVDEHPRYHLRTCVWLGTRDTIPIGVGEARQLGFTPCARCTPNATLAAAHR
ncbi:hypothetical protein DMA12_45815 [Amycolatopsis balhimycina DSM 5908]|uniref:Uncharacterized protein n=1 Tax=Amycolatopsis balhimycina DSM 5908 TaxID=1081091 RepID=A0A428VW15_AMYBA|nr:hypothetical protein [Amycolatopsis balhimycina]RSM35040.1 hypothetical protein DMA12_45815 [Amycolatopsis balhimycina DSM 5908]